jgi:hypothetical protein
MSLRLVSQLSALAVLSCAACAPLTFSNEPSVDFEEFASVVVEVGGPDGSQRQSEYLESELREHSGFRRVFGAAAQPLPGDGGAAQLLVELTMDEGTDIDLFSDDDEIDVEVSYSASARYRLFTPDGTLLDSGIESADDEPSSFDAAEQALDLVVLHYLRPYRL